VETHNHLKIINHNQKPVFQTSHYSNAPLPAKNITHSILSLLEQNHHSDPFTNQQQTITTTSNQANTEKPTTMKESSPNSNQINHLQYQQNLILKSKAPPFHATLFFKRRPIPNHPTNSSIDPSLLQEYIDNHWVIPAKSQPTCYSRIFTIKQKDKIRLIFDARYLNKFIHTNHFQVEDLRSVQRIIHPQDYMCKLDLQKAYHQIVMNPTQTSLLGFRANNQDFIFRVLPFGLNAAPMILTKALKPVLRQLRSLGIRANIYYDDILLAASSPSTLQQHLQLTIQILNEFGWRVNFLKSQLQPSQAIQYIGAQITTSPSVSIAISEDGYNNFHAAAQSLIESNQTPTYLVRRALGSLNWATRFNSLLKIYTVKLQASLIYSINLKMKFVTINEEIRQDLKQLLSLPITQFTTAALSDSNLVISTDATPSTLAASIRNASTIIDTTSTFDHSSEHINVKEAKAVLLATKTFSNLVTSSRVTFAIDNQSVVFSLRKAKSSNKTIQHIIRQIYQQLLIARPSRVWFTYVPSDKNVLSDSLSRPSTEDWATNPRVLEDIIRATKFRPEIELFASEADHLLQRFVTQQPNGRAEWHDAFSRPWSNLPNLYANPPFRLLGRVLSKINADRPNIMLIAPQWPSRPWWPLLLTADVIYSLPKHQDMFSFLGKTHAPPNWTPLVAIFKNGDNRESISQQIQPRSIRPMPSHQQTASDMESFKDFLQPEAKRTRSSIIL
jgi:hypothetical protein